MNEIKKRIKIDLDFIEEIILSIGMIGIGILLILSGLLLISY